MNLIEKFRNNIDAIRTALVLKTEDRKADAEEIETLQKFTGFGALKCVLFDPAREELFSRSERNLIPLVKELHELLRKYSESEKQCEEYVNSVRTSVLSAFYTPEHIVSALSDVFRRKGIEFEKMIDPSCGSGVFLTIKAGEKTAFEKDLLTGLILKSLHPDVKVNIAGFETAGEKYNGKFCLSASNIPFGDFRVFDREYAVSNDAVKRQSANAIHTYFFEKGLDVTRNGGLLAFITSTGVMDAARHGDFRAHLMKRADLISAVRLPVSTFSDTKVMSDLIILQKNDSKKKNTELEEAFISLVPAVLPDGKTAEDLKENGYYARRRTNSVSTRVNLGTDPYGCPCIEYLFDGDSAEYSARLGRILTSDFNSFFSRQNFEKSRTVRQKTQENMQLSLFDSFFGVPAAAAPAAFEFDSSNHLPGSFQTDGELVGKAVSGTEAEVLHLSGREREIIRGYIAVRDAYFALSISERDSLEENKAGRRKLNEMYDRFISSCGHLSTLENSLKEDPYFKEVRSLETGSGEKIGKADIFFAPTAFNAEKNSYSLNEALAFSLNSTNAVDIELIARLSGNSTEDAVSGLSERILFDPVSRSFELKERLLSGNIYEKADQFRNALSSLMKEEPAMAAAAEKSIEELEKAIPEKISLEDIDPSFGERWIPTEYFSEFLTCITGERTNVHYSPYGDEFTVTCDYVSYVMKREFGVNGVKSSFQPPAVFRYALINNVPDITYSVPDGNGGKIFKKDIEAMQLMTKRIETLNSSFKEWTRSLPESRKNELENRYNRLFNCFVKQDFNGSYQNFPDLDFESLGITDLYDTQKNAIQMVKSLGGGIIDHEVGGGKTLIQCVAAYELKRLGLANKPMIIGLKANVQEIARTFRQAYPFAKVLFADAKSYAKKNREQFLSQIQNNNWDCIIMSHDQFFAIPQSDEIQREVLQEELEKVEDCLNVYLNNENIKPSKMLLKGLSKRKENLISDIQILNCRISQRKDNTVDFVTMGIDHIFVDESHKFKNLMFQTRHSRVSGIGRTDGSQRSANLLYAIRSIQKSRGRDLGVTFLSGTVISNSLTELYNIFNYLRPKALEKQNIFSFDAWASIYCLKSSEIETDVVGDLVVKERFRKFVKVPELARFYSEITDYRTAEEIGVKRPAPNEIFISMDKTPQQEMMFENLKEFAESGDGALIFRAPLSDRESTAKMLIATNTARLASLDMRLIDRERFQDEEENECHVAADRIYDYYCRFSHCLGTQFVFSDTGTYKPGDNFNLYSEIKRILVEKGIPEEEIKFAQSAPGEKQKKALLAATNAGKVRVLFGSTETLGTGVNAQKRCVAIHHLDVPWTPKDLEQRNGRGVRTGNIAAEKYNGNKVDILVYATKMTLDTYKFNLLKNKALFISQIKKNTISARSIDEGALDKDGAMNFSEYVAILSGNTDLQEKAKLEKEYMQLKSDEKIFLKEVRENERRIEDTGMQITSNEKLLATYRKDWELFQKEMKEGKLVHVLGGKPYADAADAGRVLNALAVPENCPDSGYKEIGSFGSFKLLIKNEKKNSDAVFSSEKDVRLLVCGELKYTYNFGHLATTDKTAGMYACKALSKISEYMEMREKEISSLLRKKDGLEKIRISFPGKERLEQVTARLKEVSERIERTVASNREDDSPKKTAEINENGGNNRKKGMKISV